MGEIRNITADLGLFRDQAVKFLKKTLEEQQTCSGMYAREMDLLRKEAKSCQSGTATMVAFMQKRMKAIEVENGDVSAKLQAFLAVEVAHIAAVDADCASKVENVEKQTAAQIHDLRAKLAEADAQLASLKQFRDKKSSLEAGLEQVKQDANKRETEATSRIEQIEHQHRAELLKLRQSGLGKIVAVHQSARRLAEIELSAESKRLRIENAKLQSELQFNEAQTQRLLGENGALLSQLKNARRQLELSADKDKHYAARGAAQQRRIRELSRKVESSETNVVRLALEGKTRLAEAQQAVEAELATLRTEAADCRSLAALRERELAHMTHLVKAVLSQRTQIERFFHETLDEIKEKRQKAKKVSSRDRKTGRK